MANMGIKRFIRSLRAQTRRRRETESSQPASQGERPVRTPADDAPGSLAALFPPEFVPSVYRAAYADLQTMDDGQLLDHYARYGRQEGRIASPAATRAGLAPILNRVEKALEIGPFCNPTLTGTTTAYFDIMDQAALRLRAEQIGADPSRVPRIDHVSPNGDLGVIQDRFDLVVSSHAIEHQPDLVRHLQNVERLLLPGGIYAALIPDHRYCFDHFLRPSHVGEVLEAHDAQRTVHPLSKLIEYRAFTGHNDPARYWRGDPGGLPDRIPALRGALAEWQASGGAYLDMHSWQFTPDSFAAILSDLGALGLVGLRMSRLYATPNGSNEFIAILAKSP